MTSGHLMLIDCSAFAYRAFYSWPALRREDDGEPIGAVVGFMSLCWRLLGAAQADKPDYAVAVFDAPGKNFRHKLFPAYKANRDPARSLELEKQLPLMRPVAQVLGLTPFERKGYEADDVIATLATRASGAGIRTTIVSSDKDFSQLVRDGWVEIVDPMARSRDPNASPRRVEADVRERWGVHPHQVPHLQALAGDAVDGIPGIDGVGPGHAAALIRRWGDVERVLKNVDEIRWPAVRAALRKRAADVRLYLKLTTLKRNVPLKIDWEAFRVRPAMRADIEAIMRRLGAEAHMPTIFDFARTLERKAKPNGGDLFAWWREELAERGQRIPEEPQCGFYMRKLVKNGPFVHARIFPDKDEKGGDIIRCELGGKPVDPQAHWTALAMRPIREEDFHFEVADSAHAKKFRPHDPKAHPERAVDLAKQPAPRNPAYRNPRRISK